MARINGGYIGVYSDESKVMGIRDLNTTASQSQKRHGGRVGTKIGTKFSSGIISYHQMNMITHLYDSYASSSGLKMRYLVAAGGGGNGGVVNFGADAYYGGPGGGGRVYDSVSTVSFNANQAYSFTIGVGGNNGVQSTNASTNSQDLPSYPSNGGSTIFNGTTYFGGGHGACVGHHAYTCPIGAADYADPPSGSGYNNVWTGGGSGGRASSTTQGCTSAYSGGDVSALHGNNNYNGANPTSSGPSGLSPGAGGGAGGIAGQPTGLVSDITGTSEEYGRGEYNSQYGCGASANNFSDPAQQGCLIIRYDVPFQLVTGGIISTVLGSDGRSKTVHTFNTNHSSLTINNVNSLFYILDNASI